jgi:hypothetical protein
MDEAVRMLPQVLALDRRAVRRRFEQRFSSARMATDYVVLYRSLLERPFISERRAAVTTGIRKKLNDRVFTAINRAALPKRVVYSDFAAAPAMISDCEVSERRR